jgi:glycosyltransferase involved in cell wall biosynthesis
MVTHSFYESDNRVLRYAESLAARGDRVDVLALRRSPDLPRRETINGVTLHRIQDRLSKGEASRWSYLWPLLRFSIVSFNWLATLNADRKYDLVHVHNIPDFLIFSAWPARLRGSRLLLDIHDIVPEFFASKFNADETSRLVRALKLMERASASFADHVILANDLWLTTYTARSAAASKCSVFINYVDESVFVPRRHQSQSCNPLIVFPGGLQWHQGLDIAIRAFSRLVRDLPTARFHIYGDGSAKVSLEELVQDLGLSDHVKFFDPVSLGEVAGVMAGADIGVVPKRADSFGNEAYSTKIMEFMSIGVPVVVSRTAVDRFYFDDTVVRFFESGNDVDLAAAILDILTNQDRRDAMVRNASRYAKQNCWSQHRSRYLRLVDCLIDGAAIPAGLLGSQATRSRTQTAP